MKHGLSKREKTLLFCVGLIALVYISFQFGIYPLYTRYIAGQDEQARLADEITFFEINLTNELAIRGGNRAAHEEFEALKQAFPPRMPNEAIDSILTGMCLRNGLSPTMLRITEVDAPQESPAPNSSGEQEAAVPIFVIVTANMNLAGEYSALVDLLDEVESIEHIRLTQVSYSEPSRIVSQGSANISLVFELTMLNV
jgi:hypothetical protein